MKMMRDLFARKKAPPDTPEDKSLARRFEWRVDLSRLALVGERAWEALLWPFIVLAAFLILSMFDLWSALPPLLHRALLVAFAVALLVSLVPLIRFPMPTRAEALRRLERHADIKHRPASSYEDKLGTTSRADTALLWAAHRERLSRLVAKLKPSWPLPRTDRKDPYAVRSAFLLVLIARSGEGTIAQITPAALRSFAVLALTGVPLNASSLMGCVLLVGLVVKNGIGLDDFLDKLLDAGAYYPSAAVVGGWATTAAYHASNRPVLTRIIKAWTEGNDMLIARSNESLDILHKNYYPQVPDRDIREQFGAMRVFPTAVWRRLYSNGTITEWLQQVTDFYTRVAKIENPLTAAQYFDPSIFLSVIKQ